MEKVTVIVPVYKSEKYLKYCLDSIVTQTYGDLEIILVDDGSPDKSGAICDEYARKDSRIKVIHKSNSGSGAARNSALEISTGEIISFVDSDDMLSPVFYETMMKYFSEEIDIVECNYLCVDGECKLFSKSYLPSIIEYEVFNTENALKEHIKETKFKQVIWNKLYRKTIVGDINFPEGTKIDDEFWTYKVIGNAKKLLHLPYQLYAYRQQDNSVMHNIILEDRLLALYACVERHQYLIAMYPKLVSLSAYKLNFACLYFTQIALNCDDNDLKIKVITYCQALIKKYPAPLKTISSYSHLLWLFFSKISLKITCELRNYLKVGL